MLNSLDLLKFTDTTPAGHELKTFLGSGDLYAISTPVDREYMRPQLTKSLVNGLTD